MRYTCKHCKTRKEFGTVCACFEATDDPTILDAMRSGYIDDAHAAAKDLARQFTRLADFLEDIGDIRSDDKSQIEAEVLLAKSLAIAPNYEKFTRAVSAVRDVMED